MTAPFKTRILAAAVTGISLALLLPAQAQFWDWGNRPRPQNSNPFGGWFGGGRPFFESPPQQQAPVDYSRAPPPAQKKPEATTPIVVVGDANADWLAYGLEDAFAEKPEFGIVRKHRTDSGLISYGRRDVEWPQAVREVVAAEKPKFIVMMIGNNDRQMIREKAPVAAAKSGAQKGAAQQQPAAPAAAPAQPADPEQQPDEEKAPEIPANLTPEQARQAAYGPWEFHTERWEIAYIKRIDATIAALKSAGVPVIWVGLPSQRGPKASADSAYLNDIYRSRAEKAGIVYVDIWDGFVDESGRFSPQGPDYEGQIRRLRTGDGVYFTKFGARKLAHYVEREIQRNIANRGMPVALPMPVDQGPQGPGGPAARPAAGPVVPLTAVKAAPEELIGGNRVAPRPAIDATATRVLTKGEPIPAPTGRADDFSWPRGGPAANAEPAATDPAPAAATTPAAPAAAPAAPKKPAVAATPQQGGGQSNQPGQGNPQANGRAGGQANQQADQAAQQQAPRRPPRPQNEVLRPPLSIQGLFR